MTLAPTAPTRPAPPPPVQRRSRRAPATFYWMVLPAFALFFVFHTVPVLQGIFYSFTDYRGYGDFDLVGFANYLAAFRDDRLLSAYGFTFLVAITSTVLVNVVALAIALGLNARIRFRNTLRGVFFVPNLVSVLIIGYVFNYLFANSLPALGQALGIDALSSSILANESLAWVGIVILAVWQAAAFNIIIYLAGLQTIDPGLYEAATVDGATAWHRFRFITFPLIGAFFTINMVLSLKTFLQVFDQIVALTSGGPGTSTESVSYLIFTGGLEGGELAYQTANAVIYLVVIVVVSLAQLRILQRREADS